MVDQENLTNENESAAASSLNALSGRFGDYISVIAKHARHPLAFVVLAVALFAALGYGYNASVAELEIIETDIDTRKRVLLRPTPEVERLDIQLAGWEWSKESAVDARITRLTDSDLVAILIDAAEEADVSVFSAGVRPDSSSAVDGTNYRITPLFVKANGDLSDVERFLRLVEEQTIDSFEIRNSHLSGKPGNHTLEIELYAYSEFGDLATPTAADEKADPAPVDGELVASR